MVNLLMILLRPLYDLLYHQFAWTYDFVAAVVSLGQWQDWVRASLPFVQGASVLELGYGPGHLQVALAEKGYRVFGLDESRFMSRLAGKRLKKARLPIRLSRGYAQNLPFASSSVQSVISTFPSEYIFEPHTLEEVRRVLSPGGNFVVLPWAWITGRGVLERVAAGLAHVTGETPGPAGSIPAGLRERFQEAGLEVAWEILPLRSSALLVINATKPPHFFGVK
jgi:SAM-dependent methyltransferase